jgi:hypothetical protein
MLSNARNWPFMLNPLVIAIPCRHRVIREQLLSWHVRVSWHANLELYADCSRLGWLGLLVAAPSLNEPRSGGADC